MIHTLQFFIIKWLFQNRFCAEINGTPHTAYSFDASRFCWWKFHIYKRSVSRFQSLKYRASITLYFSFIVCFWILNGCMDLIALYVLQRTTKGITVSFRFQHLTVKWTNVFSPKWSWISVSVFRSQRTLKSTIVRSKTIWLCSDSWDKTSLFLATLWVLLLFIQLDVAILSRILSWASPVSKRWSVEVESEISLRIVTASTFTFKARPRLYSQFAKMALSVFYRFLRLKLQYATNSETYDVSNQHLPHQNLAQPLKSSLNYFYQGQRDLQVEIHHKNILLECSNLVHATNIE